MQNCLRGVGVMSGTSLDGLDLALCTFFEKSEGGYGFNLEKSWGVNYSLKWRDNLRNAVNLSSYDFIKLHREYGKFIGEEVRSFLAGVPLNIDFIASHGHTTFHEPQNNISFQIGDGATIAAHSGITTVSDFRTYDIALGGQGAPLVPIGDMELFNEYDVCVNLGGFANLSFYAKDLSKRRVAYDICPINFVINKLVAPLGLEFDNDGSIGRTGAIDSSLLELLNGLDYYSQASPKSLGQEWVYSVFEPLLNEFKYSLANTIRTCYEHFAIQIANELNRGVFLQALFTGGGTKNRFLMELIASKTTCKVVVPSSELIDFKEAIIFGFLGYLRLLKRPNCLASVTGAQRNSIGGVVHWV